MKRILLQGAMTIEIETYISMLKNKKEEIVNGYRFWIGQLGETEVVVSRTKMGIINATIASMTGITTYKPELVINQGTAGAHVTSLHTNDIVIVNKSEYLNSLKMPIRKKGKGSNSLEWQFSENVKTREATQKWVSFFDEKPYFEGKKVVGAIGSGDIYSREVDRIQWIHKKKGNLCEDMETSAVFEVCHKLAVECIGVRVISNNELTGEEFDAASAKKLQSYLLCNFFNIDSSSVLL